MKKDKPFEGLQAIIDKRERKSDLLFLYGIVLIIIVTGLLGILAELITK